MSKFYCWMRLFDTIAGELPDSDWLEQCAKCMEKFATTFDDWRNIFYRTEAGIPAERTALLQMATLAKTFGQWLNVYQEASEGDEVRPIALIQLVRLADDPQDAISWTKDKDALKTSRWMKILEICPMGNWLKVRQ